MKLTRKGTMIIFLLFMLFIAVASLFAKLDNGMRVLIYPIIAIVVIFEALLFVAMCTSEGGRINWNDKEMLFAFVGGNIACLWLFTVIGLFILPDIQVKKSYIIANNIGFGISILGVIALAIVYKKCPKLSLT